MPNYKAGFLWFPSIAAMSSLLVDSTDEDGLVFAVGINSTTWKLATWRKSSTATIDNITIFAANGPGRWVVLETASNLPFVWNSGDVADWNNNSATDWNTAA